MKNKASDLPGWAWALCALFIIVAVGASLSSRPAVDKKSKQQTQGTIEAAKKQIHDAAGNCLSSIHCEVECSSGLDRIEIELKAAMTIGEAQLLAIKHGEAKRKLVAAKAATSAAMQMLRDEEEDHSLAGGDPYLRYSSALLSFRDKLYSATRRPDFIPGQLERLRNLTINEIKSEESPPPP